MIEIAALWIAYYIVHSLLAAQATKNFVRSISGSGFRFYRIVYNILSLALFVLLYRYQGQVPAEWIIPRSKLLTIVGWAIIGFGALIGGIGFLKYSWSEFFGFRQLKNNSTKDTLHTSGLNQYVRHPLYLACLILFVGWFLKSPNDINLAFVLVSILYLFVGAWLEEKRLVKEFGDDYIQYQQKVKMIIPYII